MNGNQAVDRLFDLIMDGGVDWYSDPTGIADDIAKLVIKAGYTADAMKWQWVRGEDGEWRKPHAAGDAT